ncbi:hypothetical protein SUGI_0203830 [Cryptomeria japonica]|nr:hypothetical protein SUGI_0203830 [Cryptomeria japonica]
MTSLIKGALAKATKFTVDWVTIRYCTVVGNRLRKYGLRHDDLYDQSFDLDLQEALNRLPRENYRRFKLPSEVTFMTCWSWLKQRGKNVKPWVLLHYMNAPYRDLVFMILFCRQSFESLE